MTEKTQNLILNIILFMVIMIFFIINFVSSFENVINYESGIVCSPGQLDCKEGDVYSCNDEGNNYELKEKCIEGCVFDSRVGEAGGMRCIENEVYTSSMPYVIGGSIIAGLVLLGWILKKRK